ncbi:putative Elongation factor 2 [Blattamonas nauphoetae]|uniref:Elongation factor 2 n=1 Tax=Blattamonas nauphoetae TaxID=2049346 RepID=A0ABQ9YFZ2_9EUKA|nr:putative Elongation factor 2 [Blattamonas nauphoetae]
MLAAFCASLSIRADSPFIDETEPKFFHIHSSIKYHSISLLPPSSFSQPLFITPQILASIIKPQKLAENVIRIHQSWQQTNGRVVDTSFILHTLNRFFSLQPAITSLIAGLPHPSHFLTKQSLAGTEKQTLSPLFEIRSRIPSFVLYPSLNLPHFVVPPELFTETDLVVLHSSCRAALTLHNKTLFMFVINLSLHLLRTFSPLPLHSPIQQISILPDTLYLSLSQHIQRILNTVTQAQDIKQLIQILSVELTTSFLNTHILPSLTSFFISLETPSTLTQSPDSHSKRMDPRSVQPMSPKDISALFERQALLPKLLACVQNLHSFVTRLHKSNPSTFTRDDINTIPIHTTSYTNHITSLRNAILHVLSVLMNNNPGETTSLITPVWTTLVLNAINRDEMQDSLRGITTILYTFTHTTPPSSAKGKQKSTPPRQNDRLFLPVVLHLSRLMQSAANISKNPSQLFKTPSTPSLANGNDHTSSPNPRKLSFIQRIGEQFKRPLQKQLSLPILTGAPVLKQSVITTTTTPSVDEAQFVGFPDEMAQDGYVMLELFIQTNLLLGHIEETQKGWIIKMPIIGEDSIPLGDLLWDYSLNWPTQTLLDLPTSLLQMVRPQVALNPIQSFLLGILTLGAETKSFDSILEQTLGNMITSIIDEQSRISPPPDSPFTAVQQINRVENALAFLISLIHLFKTRPNPRKSILEPIPIVDRDRLSLFIQPYGRVPVTVSAKDTVQDIRVRIAALFGHSTPASIQVYLNGTNSTYSLLKLFELCPRDEFEKNVTFDIIPIATGSDSFLDHRQGNTKQLTDKQDPLNSPNTFFYKPPQVSKAHHPFSGTMAVAQNLRVLSTYSSLLGIITYHLARLYQNSFTLVNRIIQSAPFTTWSIIFRPTPSLFSSFNICSFTPTLFNSLSNPGLSESGAIAAAVAASIVSVEEKKKPSTKCQLEEMLDYICKTIYEHDHQSSHSESSPFREFMSRFVTVGGLTAILSLLEYDFDSFEMGPLTPPGTLTLNHLATVVHILGTFLLVPTTQKEQPHPSVMSASQSHSLNRTGVRNTLSQLPSTVSSLTYTAYDDVVLPYPARHPTIILFYLLFSKLIVTFSVGIPVRIPLITKKVSKHVEIVHIRAENTQIPLDISFTSNDYHIHFIAPSSARSPHFFRDLFLLSQKQFDDLIMNRDNWINYVEHNFRPSLLSTSDLTATIIPSFLEILTSFNNTSHPQHVFCVTDNTVTITVTQILELLTIFVKEYPSDILPIIGSPSFTPVLFSLLFGLSLSKHTDTTQSQLRTFVSSLLTVTERSRSYANCQVALFFTLLDFGVILMLLKEPSWMGITLVLSSLELFLSSFTPHVITPTFPQERWAWANVTIDRMSLIVAALLKYSSHINIQFDEEMGRFFSSTMNSTRLALWLCLCITEVKRSAKHSKDRMLRAIGFKISSGFGLRLIETLFYKLFEFDQDSLQKAYNPFARDLVYPNPDRPPERLVTDPVERQILCELLSMLGSISESVLGISTHFFSALQLSEDKRVFHNFENFTPRELLTHLQPPTTKYIGLFNPSSLCYLNSTIVQLFMHTQFRYTVLNWNFDVNTRLNVAHGPAPSQNETRPETGTLPVPTLTGMWSSLRDVFVELQENRSVLCTDLRSFISFSPQSNGSPINPSVQEDATEFLHSLFDRMESFLKAKQAPNIITKFFSGQMASQILCQNGHFSERVEAFTTIPVDVKQLGSLQNSLTAGQKGDIIKGYQCSQCKKGVTGVKQTLLTDLPNTIFFHLKRFGFTSDGLPLKLHDEFAFPIDELDMSVYMREVIDEMNKSESDPTLRFKNAVNAMSQPTVLRTNDKYDFPELNRNRDYYLFELVGVVCHYGSLNGGHYYSIIREREPPFEWYIFNDARVYKYDPANIPDDCFGGKFTADDIALEDRFSVNNQYQKGQAKRYSAFILVYQRKKPINDWLEKKVIANKEKVSPSVSPGLVNFPFFNLSTYLSASEKKDLIPHHLKIKHNMISIPSCLPSSQNQLYPSTPERMRTMPYFDLFHRFFKSSWTFYFLTDHISNSATVYHITFGWFRCLLHLMGRSSDSIASEYFLEWIRELEDRFLSNPTLSVKCLKHLLTQMESSEQVVFTEWDQSPHKQSVEKQTILKRRKSFDASLLGRPMFKARDTIITYSRIENECPPKTTPHQKPFVTRNPFSEQSSSDLAGYFFHSRDHSKTLAVASLLLSMVRNLSNIIHTGMASAQPIDKTEPFTAQDLKNIVQTKEVTSSITRLLTLFTRLIQLIHVEGHCLNDPFSRPSIGSILALFVFFRDAATSSPLIATCLHAASFTQHIADIIITASRGYSQYGWERMVHTLPRVMRMRDRLVSLNSFLSRHSPNEVGMDWVLNEQVLDSMVSAVLAVQLNTLAFSVEEACDILHVTPDLRMGGIKEVQSPFTDFYPITNLSSESYNSPLTRDLILILVQKADPLISLTLYQVMLCQDIIQNGFTESHLLQSTRLLIFTEIEYQHFVKTQNSSAYNIFLSAYLILASMDLDESFVFHTHSKVLWDRFNKTRMLSLSRVVRHISLLPGTFSKPQKFTFNQRLPDPFISATCALSQYASTSYFLSKALTSSLVNPLLVIHLFSEYGVHRELIARIFRVITLKKRISPNHPSISVQSLDDRCYVRTTQNFTVPFFEISPQPAASSSLNTIGLPLIPHGKGQNLTCLHPNPNYKFLWAIDELGKRENTDSPPRFNFSAISSYMEDHRPYPPSAGGHTPQHHLYTNLFHGMLWMEEAIAITLDPTGIFDSNHFTSRNYDSVYSPVRRGVFTSFMRYLPSPSPREPMIEWLKAVMTEESHLRAIIDDPDNEKKDQEKDVDDLLQFEDPPPSTPGQLDSKFGNKESKNSIDKTRSQKLASPNYQFVSPSFHFSSPVQLHPHSPNALTLNTVPRPAGMSLQFNSFRPSVVAIPELPSKVDASHVRPKRGVISWNYQKLAPHSTRIPRDYLYRIRGTILTDNPERPINPQNLRAHSYFKLHSDHLPSQQVFRVPFVQTVLPSLSRSSIAMLIQPHDESLNLLVSSQLADKGELFPVFHLVTEPDLLEVVVQIVVDPSGPFFTKPFRQSDTHFLLISWVLNSLRSENIHISVRRTPLLPSNDSPNLLAVQIGDLESVPVSAIKKHQPAFPIDWTFFSQKSVLRQCLTKTFIDNSFSTLAGAGSTSLDRMDSISSEKRNPCTNSYILSVYSLFSDIAWSDMELGKEIGTSFINTLQTNPFAALALLQPPPIVIAPPEKHHTKSKNKPQDLLEQEATTSHDSSDDNKRVQRTHPTSSGLRSTSLSQTSDLNRSVNMRTLTISSVEGPVLIPSPSTHYQRVFARGFQSTFTTFLIMTGEAHPAVYETSLLTKIIIGLGNEILQLFEQKQQRQLILSQLNNFCVILIQTVHHHPHLAIRLVTSLFRPDGSCQMLTDPDSIYFLLLNSILPLRILFSCYYSFPALLGHPQAISPLSKTQSSLYCQPFNTTHPLLSFSPLHPKSYADHPFPSVSLDTDVSLFFFAIFPDWVRNTQLYSGLSKDDLTEILQHRNEIFTYPLHILSQSCKDVRPSQTKTTTTWLFEFFRRFFTDWFFFLEEMFIWADSVGMFKREIIQEPPRTTSSKAILSGLCPPVTKTPDTLFPFIPSLPFSDSTVKQVFFAFISFTFPHQTLSARSFSFQLLAAIVSLQPTPSPNPISPNSPASEWDYFFLDALLVSFDSLYLDEAIKSKKSGALEDSLVGDEEAYSFSDSDISFGSPSKSRHSSVHEMMSEKIRAQEEMEMEVPMSHKEWTRSHFDPNNPFFSGSVNSQTQESETLVLPSPLSFLVVNENKTGDQDKEFSEAQRTLLVFVLSVIKRNIERYERIVAEMNEPSLLSVLNSWDEPIKTTHPSQTFYFIGSSGFDQNETLAQISEGQKEGRQYKRRIQLLIDIFTLFACPEEEGHISPTQMEAVLVNHFESVPIERIRHFCILAHVDHGKTTLTDMLISSNGVISQKTAGSIRYMDCRADEQERCITMKSASIAVLYKDTEVPDSLTYLTNIIDSPGHVDFSSEVSAAVRLSDGAIVVVDAVEGVCVQTHAVLRQAYHEGLPCILFINKIDRLCLELKLSPEEASTQLVKIVEECNVIVASLLRESTYVSSTITELATHADSGMEGVKEQETTQPTTDTAWELDDTLEENTYFQPTKGNVFFGSFIDGWAFTLPGMSKYYERKLKAYSKTTKTFSFAPVMWGDFYLRASKKKIVSAAHATEKEKSTGRTVFAQWCLSPIWEVYDAVNQADTSKLKKICSALNIQPNPKDIPRWLQPALLDKPVSGSIQQPNQESFRPLHRTLLSLWLPLVHNLMNNVISLLPSPIEAQKSRIRSIWPLNSIIFPNRDADFTEALSLQVEEDGKSKESSPSENQKLEVFNSTVAKQLDILSGVARCRPDEPTVAYISKLFVCDRDVTFLPSYVAQQPTKSRSQLLNERIARPQVSAPSTEVTLPSEGVPLHTPLSSRPPATSDDLNTSDDEADAEEEHDEHFIAFTRVFSGSLTVGDTLFLINHSFSPSSNHQPPFHFNTFPVTIGQLFLLMGKSMIPVTTVRAGCICGIAGIGSFVHKTATLSSSPFCPVLFPPSVTYHPRTTPFFSAHPSLTLTSQTSSQIPISLNKIHAHSSFQSPLASKPIFKVAVTVRNIAHLIQLERGLVLLHNADPSVEVTGVDPRREEAILASFQKRINKGASNLTTELGNLAKMERVFGEVTEDSQDTSTETNESGTYMIACSGEVHLVQCIDDLRDRYALIDDIVVSDPIVAFRETIVDAPLIIRERKEEADAGNRPCFYSIPLESIDSRLFDHLQPSVILPPNMILSKELSGHYMCPFMPSLHFGGQKGFTVPVPPMFLPPTNPLYAKESLPQGSLVRTPRIITKLTSNKKIMVCVWAACIPWSAVEEIEKWQEVDEITDNEEVLEKIGKELIGVEEDDTIKKRRKDEIGLKREKKKDGVEEEIDPEELERIQRSKHRKFWKSELGNVWALGSHRNIANLLVSHCQMDSQPTLDQPAPSTAPTSVFSAPSIFPQSVCQKLCGNEAKISNTMLPSESAQTGIYPFHLTPSLYSSIQSGFHLACRQGPLCEEPMMGMVVCLEGIWTTEKGLSVRDNLTPEELAQVTDPAKQAGLMFDMYGPLTGQLMVTMRDACREALLACSQRIVEPYLKCTVQTTEEQLGAVYTILSKRRARFTNDELRDGTVQEFIIQSQISAASCLMSLDTKEEPTDKKVERGYWNQTVGKAEAATQRGSKARQTREADRENADILTNESSALFSQSLASALHSSTSGVAQVTEMTFDHFEVLQVDPNKVLSEKEREDDGEGMFLRAPNIARDLIVAVRRRKGLRVREKIVEHAEKQKFLADAS